MCLHLLLEIRGFVTRKGAFLGLLCSDRHKPGTGDDRYTRVLGESRIRGKQLAKIENRAAVRDNLPHVAASFAQSRFVSNRHIPGSWPSV
jgi:hypothetical protein